MELFQRREKAVDDFIQGFKDEDIMALYITGSSLSKNATEKSDIDIRIFIENKELFLKLLLSKYDNINSLDNHINHSELKLFYNDFPLHILLYNEIHLLETIKNTYPSVIDTIVNGKKILYDSTKMDSYVSEIEAISSKLIESDDFLVSAKAMYVKGIARLEDENYIESLYCLRIAFTNLMKFVLRKNKVIFIKDQWILKELKKIDKKLNTSFYDNYSLAHLISNDRKKTIELISLFNNNIIQCEKLND